MTYSPRILVVEPYYGGSHQHFLEGLMAHVAAEYTVVRLPARSWKMRMQLAAPFFAREVSKMAVNSRFFDTVLCSTFLDVALFRSLVSRLAGWNDGAVFCTYFHENQFAYPRQYVDPAIRQFQYLNFSTALASDRIAFNSHYNRDSFFNGCRLYLDKAGDMAVEDACTKLAEKSRILAPGIDFSAIDQAVREEKGETPTIVWNHRWEHDKNPEAFFSALEAVSDGGSAFRLIVLGQEFLNSPVCFRLARERFRERIVHFGYAPSRAGYAALLAKGDIIVSTALHEFFGMAVLEAVRAGCRPLLPRRLSYPELFADEVLYEDHELVDALAALLDDRAHRGNQNDKYYTEPYCWANLADSYREWLVGNSGG